MKLPGAETLYKKVRNQQYLTLKFKVIFSAQVPAEATKMVLNLLIFIFGQGAALPPPPPCRALPLHPAGVCGPWTPTRFQCFSFRVILMPEKIVIVSDICMSLSFQMGRTTYSLVACTHARAHTLTHTLTHTHIHTKLCQNSLTHTFQSCHKSSHLKDSLQYHK